eukprot:EG_transcript_8299
MQTPATPSYPSYSSYHENDIPPQEEWPESPQFDSPPEKKPKVSFKQRFGQICHTFWGSLPRMLVLPIIALIVVGIFFIGAGPLFAVYSQGNSLSSLAVLNNGTTQKVCTEGMSGMAVTIQTTLVRASESSVKASVLYALSSDYSGTVANTLRLPKGYSLVVVLNSVKRTYTSGDVLQVQDVTQAMTPTSTTSSYPFYPFDSYQTNFLVSAYLQYNGTVMPMPICLTIGDDLALFSSSITLQGGVFEEEVSDTVSGESSVALATVTYSRTAITKFFSIFIVILMWAISSMVFALAIDMVFIRPREPAPPSVGLAIATLFALPAVRNVQPDAPTIGARVDVVGFFWNMVLVGLAAVLMLAGLAGYHKYGGRQSFKYV